MAVLGRVSALFKLCGTQTGAVIAAVPIPQPIRKFFVLQDESNSTTLSVNIIFDHISSCNELESCEDERIVVRNRGANLVILFEAIPRVLNRVKSFHLRFHRFLISVVSIQSKTCDQVLENVTRVESIAWYQVIHIYCTAGPSG